MIYGYSNFSQELEFKKWEELSLLENEGLSSLNNSIQKFLDKEYEINIGNIENFENIALNLINRFKKNIKILGIISVILLGLLSKDSIKSLFSKSNLSEENKEVIASKIDNSLDVTPKNKADFSIKPELAKNEIDSFLKAMADKESTSNPKSINSRGYIGKYQFGSMALKDLGIYDEINHLKFKRNPDIFPEEEQDKAMINLLKINKRYLGNYLTKYIGKTIGGVKLTKSGLLAGSHLVGARDVKRFLDSNGKYIPKDGNHVPVTEYIKKFGGYNITL